MAHLNGIHVFAYWHFQNYTCPIILTWLPLVSYKFIAFDVNNNPTKFQWIGKDFDKYIVTRKYYERNL